MDFKRFWTSSWRNHWALEIFFVIGMYFHSWWEQLPCFSRALTALNITGVTSRTSVSESCLTNEMPCLFVLWKWFSWFFPSHPDFFVFVHRFLFVKQEFLHESWKIWSTSSWRNHWVLEIFSWLVCIFIRGGNNCLVFRSSNCLKYNGRHLANFRVGMPPLRMYTHYRFCFCSCFWKKRSPALFPHVCDRSGNKCVVYREL